MRPTILIDTGPIVAALDQKDMHHAWATEQFKALPAPLLTCEAVLTEAAFLIQRTGYNPDRVLDLLTTGALRVSFDMETEVEAVKQLVKRYESVPMDLADACLVRMTEMHPDNKVLTVDSDFHIYRKHGREAIEVIMP